MLDADYEGAAELEQAWREGLTPDPLLTVSEWSDRHRMLSSKASAEPGRTSRTPYATLPPAGDWDPIVGTTQIGPRNPFDESDERSERLVPLVGGLAWVGSVCLRRSSGSRL